MDGYGDRVKQVLELDSAAECLRTLKDPQMWLAARVGAGYARNGEISNATECLRCARKRADPESAQSRSYLNILEGEIALAQGSHAKALELLSTADRESPTSETVANLARAFDIAGVNVRAMEYYEKMIVGGRAFLGWEPQQAWLLAHIRLAEIYLVRGEREKAATVLRTLQELWKQADQDLPLNIRIQKLSRELSIAENSLATNF